MTKTPDAIHNKQTIIEIAIARGETPSFKHAKQPVNSSSSYTALGISFLSY